MSSKYLSNYNVVRHKDIIYTKSPTSDFPYGIIKQNRLNRSGVVSVLYGVYEPINSYVGFLIHEYFISWINTYNYLNPIVQKGAKNTINIGDSAFLDGAKIAMPSDEREQKKLATFLNDIDNEINAAERKLEQAKQFKKALLQQMFV